MELCNFAVLNSVQNLMNFHKIFNCEEIKISFLFFNKLSWSNKNYKSRLLIQGENIKILERKNQKTKYIATDHSKIEVTKYEEYFY